MIVLSGDSVDSFIGCLSLSLTVTLTDVDDGWRMNRCSISWYSSETLSTFEPVDRLYRRELSRSVQLIVDSFIGGV